MSALPPGVAAARRRALKMQKRMALAIVGIPTAGFAAAMFLLWGRGLGPVELGILLGMYVLTAVGITAGYHRHFAHKAFQTSPALRAALAIIGSMTFQGPVIWWSAVHRHHHTVSDQPGDPHSPHLSGIGLKEQIRGLWHAHVRWMFVYDLTGTDWARYVPDLLRDRTIFRISQLYFLWVLLGLAIPGLLGGLLTGTWKGAFLGFVWGGLVRIFVVDHITWSINSICHAFGRHPLESHDQSRNNGWLALPSFGEAWHNNHHVFPNSAKMGLAWWQIDLTGYLLRALEAAGLVWNLNIPSQSAIDARRVRAAH